MMIDHITNDEALRVVALVFLGLIGLGILGIAFRIMMKPISIIIMIGLLGWVLYASTL